MRKGLSPFTTVQPTCKVSPALLGVSPNENGNIFGFTANSQGFYFQTSSSSSKKAQVFRNIMVFVFKTISRFEWELKSVKWIFLTTV